MGHVENIIQDASALSVEDRALVIEALVRTMTPPESEIDRQWAEVARRRLDDIRSGAVETVPGEEVFDRIRNRFAR